MAKRNAPGCCGCSNLIACGSCPTGLPTSLTLTDSGGNQVELTYNSSAGQWIGCETVQQQVGDTYCNQSSGTIAVWWIFQCTQAAVVFGLFQKFSGTVWSSSCNGLTQGACATYAGSVQMAQGTQTSGSCSPFSARFTFPTTMFYRTGSLTGTYASPVPFGSATVSL